MSDCHPGSPEGLYGCTHPDHAADIHLDSPLRRLSQFGETSAETLRSATRVALRNLVDLAIAESIRGNFDASLNHLRAAVAGHEYRVFWMSVDPLLEGVRSKHPGFAAVAALVFPPA